MNTSSHRSPRWIAVLVGLFLLAGIGSGVAQEAKRGKFVHSFPPVPLFRGVTNANEFRGRAAVYISGRNTARAADDPASVDIAVDVAAVDPTTGLRLSDFCIERSLTLDVPLDLQRIDIEVTQTGVQFTWPGGEVQDVPLFAAGDDVEVAILAFALRPNGTKLPPIERASMRVLADLDGDGTAEFSQLIGADSLKGGGFGVTG